MANAENIVLDEPKFLNGRSIELRDDLVVLDSERELTDQGNVRD